MTTRSEELAKNFGDKNLALLGLVEGLSDEQWKTICPEEGWTVGVTAHHVAESIGNVTGLVQALASGASVPAITADALDQGNAEHAARASTVTKMETTKLFRQNIDAGAAAIRSLNESQLQRTAVLPSGEMTAEQIVEGIMIGHTGMHIEGIRAATV